MSKIFSYITLILTIFLFSMTKIEAVWNLPPVPISSENASNPQIGIDTSGNAVAVWLESSDSTSTVMGATLPFCGSGWTTPVAISANTAGFQTPEVAVDPNGNAVAVWVTVDPSDNIVQGAILPFGQTNWTPTTDLSSPGVPPAGFAAIPQVAIDPKGNAVAVWVITNSSENNVIQGATLASGSTTWIPAAANLSPGDQESYNPQVAVDLNGNAVAVWDIFNSDTSQQTIQAKTLTFGSNSWSATTLNSGSSASFPQVGLDANGNAVAIWGLNDGVNTVNESSTLQFGTTTWTDPIYVSDPLPSQKGVPSQIAVDLAGNAVAIWSENESPDVFIKAATLAFNSNMWSTPASTLSTAGGQAFDSQVKVDAAGNAFAIWSKDIAPSFTDTIIQSAQLPFGQSWTSPPIDLSNPDQVSRFPQIAVNPSGYAVAIWSNDTLTQIEATTYLTASAVTNINPNVGSTTGGNIVIITGTNFCDVESVKFGPNDAISFAVVSGTSIQATVPPGNIGTVDVTVTNNDNSSAITQSDHYTYIDPNILPKEPKKFHALLIRKHHLHNKKHFSMHTWWDRSKQPPTIDFYKIYKNNKVIQKISVKKKPRFNLHVRSPHHVHKKYKIRAVSTDGLESSSKKLRISWIKH